MTNNEAEALRAEVRAMREEFKVLQKDMRELLDAWRLANGLLKAVKLIAAIASGFAAIGTLLAAMGHFTPKGH